MLAGVPRAINNYQLQIESHRQASQKIQHGLFARLT
jgi:hypothetical protein